MNPIIRKHAEVLLKYSIDLKKGESILITGEVATLPLIRECYAVALELGGHPITRISDPTIGELAMKLASDEQLKYIQPSTKSLYESIDAFISVMGTSNTRNMSNIPAERMRLSSQARAPLTKIYFERMKTGSLRWCGTLFPTLGNAQEASMSITDYEEFVFGACKLLEDDPIALWKEVDQQQERICKIMDTKKTLHIKSKDTDLRMKIGGRKWVNCSGRVNFPDGEVFTGPIEDSVEGHIRFSFPGIFSGRAIEDIQLTFEKGKVVKATASKGEDLLLQLLDTDPGARFVGEIAVGTNYNIQRFTRNMLFDEKIGGTVHLAVGRSIPDSLGKNESAIHWDMLCDMKDGGEIYADDELIYKDGKFLI